MAYITVRAAAVLFGLEYSHLINMCHSGKIPIITLKSNGDKLVSETAVLQVLPLDSQPEYEKYKWMAGKGIGMREASQKYNIPHQTISRWVKTGWLPVIAINGRKKLIDQAIMAYAAEIYTSRAGQGRWVFKSNGVPYRRDSS
jgi:predicted site-specific integrase-resolvase